MKSSRAIEHAQIEELCDVLRHLAEKVDLLTDLQETQIEQMNEFIELVKGNMMTRPPFKQIDCEQVTCIIGDGF